MTYLELLIQFDLNPDHRVDVLKNAAACRLIRYGYLFVDQEDGQCYLFDKNGNLDDINKVKRIGNEAFIHCMSLTYIKIPNSVEIIGNWAFWKCWSLKSIKIPNSVESIGYNAFYDCTSLKEVVFDGKTMDEVKTLYCYPWGIKDESIIKVES